MHILQTSHKSVDSIHISNPPSKKKGFYTSKKKKKKKKKKDNLFISREAYFPYSTTVSDWI